MFAQVLRDMGREDLIVQMHDDHLVVGAEGERIVSRYDFYPAFTTVEEFRVVAEGRSIGSFPIDLPPPAGSVVIFAGRRWRVIEVDATAKAIVVTPATGGSPPRFGGGGGRVHSAVRRRMFRIFCETAAYRYLDGDAARLLTEGRQSFQAHSLQVERLVTSGADTYYFPWCGDQGVLTLVLVLRMQGLDANAEGLAIRIGESSREEVHAELLQLRDDGVMDPLEVASGAVRLDREKFDWVLSEDLYIAQLASAGIDVEDAWASLADLG
jgi:ATP-dependent Lhr-like helicase